MNTTYDLSNWSMLALVDKWAACNDLLVTRGLPARDITAEFGFDTLGELRAFAIALDRNREQL